MARSQTAYINRKDVPARADLQKAIDQLGFKVTLDHAYAPFKTSGYLPCTLDGEDAGFNMRFDEVASNPRRRSRPASKDATPRSVSAGPAIRARSLPRSRFVQRLSSNSARSCTSRTRTSFCRSIN